MGLHHKYQHFALDKNDKYIHIKDVKKSDNKQYFCPNCHKEVIAKRGNIRQWHFAHKAYKCSYDKYLHSIAEIMIKNWFNNQESIMLTLNDFEKCNRYNECVFYEESQCRNKGIGVYDLKQYYTECIEEHGYKGFVADLFCMRSNKSDSPIFIEICVTHKCSMEKKASGIRIIEFVIKSEDDILKIINFNRLEKSKMVRLYNFKPKERLVSRFVRPVIKYRLSPTLKGTIEEKYIACTCKNYTWDRQGIFEITKINNGEIYYSKDWEIQTIEWAKTVNAGYYFWGGSSSIIGKVKAYLSGLQKKDRLLYKKLSVSALGSIICKYEESSKLKNRNYNDASKYLMFNGYMKDMDKAIAGINSYSTDDGIDIWDNSMNSSE